MTWEASKFTDEHRAALDWLNDNAGAILWFTLAGGGAMHAA